MKLLLRPRDVSLLGIGYRDIAQGLFGDRVPDDAAWRTHPIRATTIRLVREGRAMMRGGYLRLLRDRRLRCGGIAAVRDSGSMDTGCDAGESAGEGGITSPAGAMGLMQVMPQTYATLRARLGLGANAYDPHDNIMAGAAFLRDMHDRYGDAGFLLRTMPVLRATRSSGLVVGRCRPRRSCTWRGSVPC